jgi:hypothetical protein
MIACLLSWIAPALHAATLHYEAFLGGLPVGDAIVVVQRADPVYRISGSASVTGVAHLLSDWRSRFYASGRLVDGAPYLEAYGYDERDGDKHRVLELRDGMVTTTKNGRPRARFPVLGGLDVLTAFFVTPGCWQEKLLHTGRFKYSVVGTPSSNESHRCRFLVRDDDGDENRVVVVFSRVQGMLLPEALYTFGVLRGRVVLRRVDPGAESDPYASGTHPVQHDR